MVPGQGALAPLDMISEENDGSLRLIKRWIEKEKKTMAAAQAKKQARAAEAAKADAVFGKAGKGKGKKDEL
jgi:hypothetical protein